MGFGLKSEGIETILLSMNAEEIRQLCMAGTEAYLDFLVANGGGLNVINVLNIVRVGEVTDCMFKLTLTGRLFDPDCISLRLVPPNQIYGPEHFRVVEYDNDARTLIVQVSVAELVLDHREPESICVVWDLKFLVRNVKRWFELNGAEVQLPQQVRANEPGGTSDTGNEHASILTASQKQAVLASWENPLTYVWGPPGTGKTKHVLTESALGLISAEKRIAIFAPTNNALEQAMTAILKAADHIGIGREKFLRVGNPSTHFANEFPEVCEVRGIQQQIAQLRRQIRVYDIVLHHRRGARVLNSAAVVLVEIRKLRGQLSERMRIYQELSHARRNPVARVVRSLDGTLRSLDAKRTELESVINGQLEMIRLTPTESPQLNAIINVITFTSIDTAGLAIEQLETKTRQFIDVNQALANDYDGQTEENILMLRGDLEQQVHALEAQDVRVRIDAARVVGMTLDCLIGRFYDTFLRFDHIFLDEAGYAPLVKALTLCRRGIPMTFLGDHKQLGPVCEMNNESLRDPRNAAAILWKKSALFLDEPHESENGNELIENLFNVNEPRLRLFREAKLSETFRFGLNLADILAECVYGGVALVAGTNHDHLEIICIDSVPQAHQGLRRENPAEVGEIASYLEGHPEVCGDGEGAWAILSPYRNQVGLLGQRLSTARREGRIMTVNKAQGREWDTVIISVVDGHAWYPWFTDTTNAESGGLHVMNTAVSRAKKRLVIVCNSDYWLAAGRENQLIARLLRL